MARDPLAARARMMLGIGAASMGAALMSGSGGCAVAVALSAAAMIPAWIAAHPETCRGH